MLKYNKFFKHIKHIFFITVLSVSLLFGYILIFSGEFSNAINGFFVYRTGNGVWQDYFYQHKLRPSSDIVLITIDDNTINKLQAKWDLKMLTISKKYYSDLVTKLSAVGVQGIAFDIVFQNADPDENAFVNIMRKHDNIVIGVAVWAKNNCVTHQKDGTITCDGYPRLAYTPIPWGMFNVGSFSSSRWSNLEQSAFMRPTKIDIRDTDPWRWKLNSNLSTQLYSLAIALRKLKDPSVIRKEVFRHPTILSPYLGPPWSYRKYSFADVLEMSDKDIQSNFGGKYVFVGESGTLIHDSFTSPVSGTMVDGVESHAHFFDALLQDKLLFPFRYNFALAVLLALITIGVYYFIPKQFSYGIMILAILVILTVARYTYDAGRTIVDIFPLFLAGGVLTFPATYIYRFFVVDREKRHIEQAFSRYVDPKVVKMIDENQLNISLGGERKVVSVMFSDIAGFTSISEHIGTQELFYLMSAYLSRMTDILIGEWWTLDKYIGDAIMGFFGAPIMQSDHAIRACRTAIMMQQALPDFNKEIAKQWLSPISFRVGIATGEAMIGNIGSKRRFNYTALGDTVNLAARLEWVGKEYGVNIVISESVKERIDALFATRELDIIAAKWKTTGVKIYELVGIASDNSKDRIIQSYEQALSLYRAEKYLEAGKLWESMMATDKPSEVMARRCLEILKGNLVINNGVYQMTHK